MQYAQIGGNFFNQLMHSRTHICCLFCTLFKVAVEIMYPLQKPAYSLYCLVAPGFVLIQRPHKHLVNPCRISPVIPYYVSWIYNISPSFTHPAAVGTENSSLVTVYQKRLVKIDIACIIKHLGKKPRIQQMSVNVFGTSQV